MINNWNEILLSDMQDLYGRNLSYTDIKNKTVLVTGAGGMLAAYAVYFFMYLNETENLNIKVIALVRNKDKAMEKFSEFAGNENFRFLIQDVCDPIMLEEQVDYIVHAAGNASPHFILNDPVGIIKANTLGTFNILEFARRAKTRKVLYLSTREVYGKMDVDVEEIPEELFGGMDPLEFRSCYPESKRIAESILQSYYRQFNVPFAVVRIAHSYGPVMNIDNDGRVMADFIADICNNRNIMLKSTGDAERAFCYITDAVAGMLFALLKGECGEAYNVANEKDPKPIREVAELLVGLFPEKQLKVVFNIPKSNSEGYSKMGRVKLNTAKLEKLGWSCQVDLATGMKRTVEYFSSRG